MRSSGELSERMEVIEMVKARPDVQSPALRGGV